jgi:hypothetical protein
METYFLEAEHKRPSTRERIIRFVLFLSIAFTVSFAGKCIWPSNYERHQAVLIKALDAGMWGVAMATFMTFWMRPPLLDSTLIIDDSSITTVSSYKGWMKRYEIRKVVHRGEIRTIRDVRNLDGEWIGAKISEKSGIREWFAGYLFLSKRLPDYEKIRAVAVLWQSPNA